MKSKKLLIVGELNIDIILNDIQGLPHVGSEIIADKMDFTMGSSSAIMACNISKLGVDTSFCGLIGEDEFGDFILKNLQKQQVDINNIKVSSTYKTGMTMVLNYAQDRANVTYCGAMEKLSYHDIPWNQISSFSHFHLSNLFLQKNIKKDIVQIFRAAKENGLTTSLDLQVDPENEWLFDYKACLPYVDIFLPNEAELKALTKEENINAALRKIKDYANILALKLGDKGSRIIQGDTKIDCLPYVVDDFVDAIGAGDSFNAGFIKKFLEDASLEECGNYANLIGAHSTTKPGGINAFLNSEYIKSNIELIGSQNETKK